MLFDNSTPCPLLRVHFSFLSICFRVLFFWCMFGSFNADFGCQFKRRALGECWPSFFSPYLNRTFYFLPSILLFVILILICFSRIITIRSVAFRCSRKYFIAVTLANTIIGRLLCCTRRVMCLFCIGCDIHCHLPLLTLRVFFTFWLFVAFIHLRQACLAFIQCVKWNSSNAVAVMFPLLPTSQNEQSWSIQIFHWKANEKIMKNFIGVHFIRTRAHIHACDGS